MGALKGGWAPAPETEEHGRLSGERDQSPCGRRKFLLIPFWAWERYHSKSLQPGSLIPGQEVGKGFGSLESGHQYLLGVNPLPQERALGLRRFAGIHQQRRVSVGCLGVCNMGALLEGLIAFAAAGV